MIERANDGTTGTTRRWSITGNPCGAPFRVVSSRGLGGEPEVASGVLGVIGQFLCPANRKRPVPEVPMTHMRLVPPGCRVHVGLRAAISAPLLSKAGHGDTHPPK